MEEKIKNKSGIPFKKRFFRAAVFLVFGFFVLNFANPNTWPHFKETPFSLNKVFITSIAAQDGDERFDEARESLGITSGALGLGKQVIDASGKGAKAVALGAISPLLIVFNILLYCVFVVVSLLMFLGGMVMDWAIDPANFTLVVGSKAVLNGWKIVRDFLNLAFILILLFSAFCTIFQVEKYHLKKILLTLVIMALLVNFSFPVARFIVDASNVLMYYFLNSVFPNLGQGLSGQLAWAFGAVKAIAPEFKVGEWTPFVGNSWDLTIKLIAAIIFTFLFAITMLIIAVLLVIRIVVLAILIIFAPVGFVAAIFPSTKGYADSWWSQLFKQSFFGPIMVFMIYLAFTLMTEINAGLVSSIGKVVNANNAVQVGGVSGTKPLSDYSTIIVNGTALAIPIVLLWVGLIAAQKMGAAGAEVVVGRAKRFTGWARRQPWRGTKALVGATGITGGIKQTYDYYRKRGIPIGKRRFFGTEQREEKEAWVAGKIPGGAPVREDYERKKAAAIRKEWKDQGGISEAEIASALAGKDRIRARAAAMEAAETVGFGKPDDVALVNYKRAAAAVASDPLLKNIFDNKVKEKNIKLKIESDTEGTIAERYVKHLADLTPEQIAQQKGIHDDENFHNYVRSNIKPYFHLHQQIFGKLKSEDRQKWVRAGLAPGSRRTASPEGSEGGTGRPAEDVERERAQRAQEEINRQFPEGT